VPGLPYRAAHHFHADRQRLACVCVRVRVVLLPAPPRPAEEVPCTWWVGALVYGCGTRLSPAPTARPKASLGKGMRPNVFVGKMCGRKLREIMPAWVVGGGFRCHARVRSGGEERWLAGSDAALPHGGRHGLVQSKLDTTYIVLISKLHSQLDAQMCVCVRACACVRA
jgi:hypothetical protein